MFILTDLAIHRYIFSSDTGYSLGLDFIVLDTFLICFLFIVLGGSPTPNAIPDRSGAFSLCKVTYRSEWSLMGLRAPALGSSLDRCT